jgi:carbamoyl-phosphate synthase large subunit
MNLLFTSAGRRGYLLEYFREAVAGRGLIHAANSDKYAPAFLHADKAVITPPIHSPDYINCLKKYCLEQDITAIIPLFDLDLPVLARAAGLFADIGVTVVVSSQAVTDVCDDKMATLRFLNSHGFVAPLTFSSLVEAKLALENGEISFPLVVKPRWGMGSIGLHTVEGDGELDVCYGMTMREIQRSYLKTASMRNPENAVLIQQQLSGVEYGLDVINDLMGQYVTTFSKKKLAMRAGETDSAIIVDDIRLTELGAQLGKALGHVGNLDVDLFVSYGKLYVLELNCRFGGGYPFSHVAGADIPRAIVAWLSRQDPDPAWFRVKAGVVSVKDILVSAFD